MSKLPNSSFSPPDLSHMQIFLISVTDKFMPSLAQAAISELNLMSISHIASLLSKNPRDSLKMQPLNHFPHPVPDYSPSSVEQP